MRMTGQQVPDAAAVRPAATAKDGGHGTFLVREERRHAGGRKFQDRRCGQAGERSGLLANARY
jgi:hypothetical protein